MWLSAAAGRPGEHAAVLAVQTGTLVGTPAYLAPERAAGAPATPASDLYSLGVVAYECLVGAVPFSGSPLEIAAAHRHRPLPPLPPGVPPGVAALAAALTVKDPAARPASAAVVAERAGRLRDILTPGTVLHGGPDPIPPAGTAAEEQSATLVNILPPAFGDGEAAGRPPAHSWGWVGRSRPARVLVLALAAVAITAGLAGWLMANALRGTLSLSPAQSATAQPASSAPAPRTVMVDDAPLVGQPVSAVRQQLRLLGLQPRVAWIPSGQQVPGTVVSVQPTGQLHTGAIVLVTATLPPHHGQGNGNGNGNGNGDGGGGGGD